MDLDKAKAEMEAAKKGRDFVNSGPHTVAEHDQAEMAYTQAWTAYNDASAEHRLRQHHQRVAADTADAAAAERERQAALPKREFIPGVVGRVLPGASPEADMQARRERFTTAVEIAQAGHEARVTAHKGRPKGW